MKRVAFIAVIISLLVSACKTQQQAVSVNNDDVYSTPSRQKAKSTSSPNYNQDLTSALAANQSAVAHDSLKAKAATLDYSDVSYADRLKKFQHPQSNTSYFGNTSADTSVGCCNSPNVNINLGYDGGFYDWGPSLSFGFGMGFGWGYPSYWDSPYWWYYNPYPYWGYPYWYHGYYPYWEGGYYNSYYGPRQSTARNTAYTRDKRGNSTTAPSSRNDRGVPATANNRSAPPSAVRSTNQNGTPARSANQVTTQRQTPASQDRYHYIRPANERQGTYNRNTGQGNAYRDSRQQPAPRYTQPGTASVQRQGQVQNYTPGNYRQARSSQEYINPRVQTQNSAGRPATTSGNRGSSSVNQRGYSSPGNSSGSRTQQYSSPRNYSPSRGYTPSHFAPSGGAHSGGGYSGGGGGRSGGGGGGGGHSGGGGGGGHSGGGGGGGGGGRR